MVASEVEVDELLPARGWHQVQRAPEYQRIDAPPQSDRPTLQMQWAGVLALQPLDEYENEQDGERFAQEAIRIHQLRQGRILRPRKRVGRDLLQNEYGIRHALGSEKHPADTNDSKGAHHFQRGTRRGDQALAAGRVAGRSSGARADRGDAVDAPPEEKSPGGTVPKATHQKRHQDVHAAPDPRAAAASQWDEDVISKPG